MSDDTTINESDRIWVKYSVKLYLNNEDHCVSQMDFYIKATSLIEAIGRAQDLKKEFNANEYALFHNGNLVLVE